MSGHMADLHVSVRTIEGGWANARVGMRPPGAPAWPALYASGTLVAAIFVLGFWMSRRVTQPLQRLAEAAGALRQGELRGAVPESGPAPVREAARAFNAMSERVMTMLKSQRAMMAAVAHDLRTPIAALRFRAEFVSDEETRKRLLETLDEMQLTTEAVLDAMRAGSAAEPSRSVDVASLAESLCADMTELGGDVSFSPSGPAICSCRITEVRRALRNLIENAQRYGVRARVSTEVSHSQVLVHVDDDGRGIPDDQIERVFEPFARLEESRSSDTGGHGLGLAIARLIARGHGGDVRLENRAGGGLRATLSLPQA
jgi:signal transduction histidine kinase